MFGNENYWCTYVRFLAAALDQAGLSRIRASAWADLGVILHWKSLGALCRVSSGLSTNRVCSQINTGDLRQDAFFELGGEHNGLAPLVERRVDVEGMQDRRDGDSDGGVSEVLSRAGPR